MEKNMKSKNKWQVEGVVTEVFHSVEKYYVIINGKAIRKNLYEQNVVLKCFLPTSSITEYSQGEFVRLAGRMSFGRITYFVAEEVL